MLNFNKLEKLLAEQGIKKTFLCSLLGKDYYYYKNLKAGKTSISAEALQIWADSLNTTVEYLTDKTEQKEKPAEIGRLIAEVEKNYLLLNEENRKKVNERIEEYIKLLLHDQE